MKIHKAFHKRHQVRNYSYYFIFKFSMWTFVALFYLHICKYSSLHSHIVAFTLISFHVYSESRSEYVWATI